MKHIAFRALFLLLSVAHPVGALAQANEPRATPANQPLKVLFVGNSYTYYNNLSSIGAAFAAAAQDSQKVQPKDHTMGAATLEKLWDLRPTRYLLADEKWDFVVLQEHSSLPITSPEQMYESARKFDSAIKKNGARTVLFLTWARAGAPGTQSSLNSAYSRLATELGAIVAPVGPAWQVALERDPKIPLYNTDGRHPSATGSYLAACTLYLVISGSQQPCAPLELEAVLSTNATAARAAAQQAVTTWRNLSQQPK